MQILLKICSSPSPFLETTLCFYYCENRLQCESKNPCSGACFGLVLQPPKLNNVVFCKGSSWKHWLGKNFFLMNEVELCNWIIWPSIWWTFSPIVWYRLLVSLWRQCSRCFMVPGCESVVGHGRKPPCVYNIRSWLFWRKRSTSRSVVLNPG